MDASGGLSMDAPGWRVRPDCRPDSGRKIGVKCPLGKGYSATSCAGFRLAFDAGDECFQRHGAQILAGPQADRDLALRRLALAHHQHVGDFLQLGVADLLLHPLVGGVDVDAQAGRAVDHRGRRTARPRTFWA